MEDAWDEADSALYRRLANLAVPRRVEQIATVLALLPLSPAKEGRVVELGCGAGTLSHALLDAFPRCRVTALDGSPSMIAHASAHLRRFSDRASVEPFRLDSVDWLERVRGAEAVVTSLCLHHLEDSDKRSLFAGLAERLAPGGALLIADLVAPAREEAASLFRESWDRDARAVDEEGFALFERERWNVYRHPDPADRPSRLFEQLCWLSDGGFAVVDCFWMAAGHAVYGGYRAGGASGAELDYEAALAAARRAIEATR